MAKVLKTTLPAYHKYHQQKDGVMGLQAQLSLKDYLTLNIRNAITQALRPFDSGLVALASIGAVAPFIGLFGTVWGIFNALMDIRPYCSRRNSSNPNGRASTCKLSAIKYYALCYP